MKRYTSLAGLGIYLSFLVAGLGLMYLNRPIHQNPCTANVGNCYSIQGVYSQLKCPGQHVGTVEVNGQTFFLECFGSSKE